MSAGNLSVNGSRTRSQLNRLSGTAEFVFVVLNSIRTADSLIVNVLVASSILTQVELVSPATQHATFQYKYTWGTECLNSFFQLLYAVYNVKIFKSNYLRTREGSQHLI